MKPLFFTVAWVCAALPAWAIPVSISVVGPDDKPLPMARVSLTQSVGGEPTALALSEPVGPNGQLDFEWDGPFPGEDATTIERRAQNVLWARIAAPGMATQMRQLAKSATTIRLTAGRVWGGVVRDQNDAPVAGVPVQIEQWQPLGRTLGASGKSGFYAFDPNWKLQSLTDENGRWQMEGLPMAGTTTVRLNDDRFVKSDFDLNLKGASAPPLFVQTGATIRGQIVTPTGEPIRDTMVYVSWDSNATARTDGEGRFVMSGVETGKVTLTLEPYSPKPSRAITPPDFLVPRLPYVAAIAGKTTDIGQWQAQTGTLISARVVDDLTGAPIEGAQFWVANVGYRAVSDSTGQIQVRVLPPSDVDLSRFFGRAGQISADGYLDAPLKSLPEIHPPNALDAGTVRLQRGTRLRGRVGVEEQNAETLRLPWLKLIGENGSELVVIEQGTAEFVTKALKAGSYRVALNDNSTVDGDWRLMSPLTVSVVGPDTASEPVKIVLQRWPLSDNLMREARGRIVDEDGSPVSGAVVRAIFNRNTAAPVTAITGDDGEWSARNDRPATSVALESVERPGYITMGAAQTKIVDGVGMVGGLTLRRRGARFSGRVLDAEGKPAQDAWVAALEARDVAPVQTDANGRFELRDLPLDKFTLVAAKDKTFARLPAEATSANVALGLQAPAPADRTALAERVLEGERPNYDLFRYWQILGAARMEALVGESSGGRALFALELARRDPSEFVRRAPQLIESLDARDRDPVEAQLFWMRAASDDAAEKLAAQNWVDEQKTIKRPIDVTSVTKILRVATVAHRLGRADADALVDFAATLAQRTNYDSTLSSSLTRWKWSEITGQTSAPVIERFVEGAGPLVEFDIWNQAASQLAQQGRAKDAWHALARLETLASAPELESMSNGGKTEGAWSKAKRARLEVARELADSDVAAAWQTLEGRDDAAIDPRPYLIIADRAMEAGNAEIATKALRVAVKMLANIETNSPLAASLGQEVSPQLGDELWAQARLNTAKPRGSSYQPSIAMWAFYHARLDAGLSRIMLEREWSWRVPAATAQTARPDKLWDGDDRVLGQLLLAMTAVDPTRAMEMRAQRLADKSQTATDATPAADFALAAALLASDAQRIRFDIDSPY